MNRAVLLSTISAATFILNATLASAADVRLAWDANTEHDLAGYRVYWGESSRSFQQSADAGRSTRFTVRNLAPGRLYYFSVRAYDAAGNNSQLAPAISRWLAVLNPGTPGGGGALPRPGDSDGDALSNSDEVNLYHTDPQRRDTDNDGLDDGSEVRASSDPRDRGSFAQTAADTLCLPWNSFLGMWNVLEQSNRSTSQLTADMRIYRFDGTVADQSRFFLPGGAQYDVLVHDALSAKSLSDSYGIACTSAPGSSLDSRMIYYKPSFSRPDEFEFALAAAPASGISGPQFVTFNTYQPSLNPLEANNAVAVWNQITNRSATEQRGSLITYDQSGAVHGTIDVSIPPNARRDFAGHEIGKNLVGLVEWRPADWSAKFEFLSARYLYDNPHLAPSFVSAFQLTAEPGSGRPLAAPLDTERKSAILEIANTTGRQIVAEIEVYNAAGELKAQFEQTLAPHASHHIITDHILRAEKGLAVMRGSEAESVFASAMHYARDEQAGVKFIYGIPAKEALLRNGGGSYNTWLDQAAQLWVLNPGAVEGNAAIRVLDSSGNQLGDTIAAAIPAHGLHTANLNAAAPQNTYGRVVLDAGENSLFAAWVTRERPNQYMLALPLR